MRGEADKEIARREARANQPFFESAERPALLASYINPKKGQFFGSLAKGIAAIDIEEEKARKELAQYRATEADKVRQLNNTYRQMQIESAKYVAASKENDLKTAQESAEKLAALRYKYENDKADLAIKRDTARAQIAAAGKPPGEIALMEWLRSPTNRKVYEDVQNIKRDEDRQLKLYEIYTKNKLSLGDTTFEQFLAGFKQAGEDVKDRPPPGAVKQKGTQ